MVTAETAVVLPMLVLILGLLLGIVGHSVDVIRVIDAARSGARLAARGESHQQVRQQTLAEAPQGSEVDVELTANTVVVRVASPPRRLLGLIELPAASSHATALMEGSG